MSTRNFEQLSQILKNETSLQDKLLKLLSEERNYIVKLQTDQINKIQSKKEKVLTEIANNKKQIKNILSDLGVEPPSKYKEQIKLSQLIEKCESPNLKVSLEGLISNLKETASAVSKLNLENGDLIKRTLGLVSNTISILNARPSIDDNNYSKDGKVKNADNSIAPGKSAISSFKKQA